MVELDVAKELKEAQNGTPIVLPDMAMPLDITIRTIALTIAQKHCGDTVIKEGNMYQALKAEGKLIGSLTSDHIVHTALFFETYLWGKFSQNIANNVIEKTIEEAGEVAKDILDVIDERRKKTERGSAKDKRKDKE